MISGNGIGSDANDNEIQLRGSNNLIIGNYIGVAADGTTVIGNLNDGIDIGDGTGNTIGGTALNEGNIIAGHTDSGVKIQNAAVSATIIGNTIYGNDTGVKAQSSTSGNFTIRQNSIYSNNLLGINLVGGAGETGAGVTPNDGLDADAGPNDYQNFPVLASAVTNPAGTQVTITGTVNSKVNTPLRIEFFASSAADPSGNGEGQRYLGFLDVTTNNITGNAAINAVLVAPVFGGEIISATATRANALFTQFFETSEFSGNVTATATGSISGTIWNDVDADADVTAGDGTTGLAGATVYLFRDTAGAGAGSPDATDVWVATTITNGSGQYSFTNLNDATYWVVVDSKTLSGSTSAWGEQTYGDDSTTAALDLNARFGGRNATLSDNASAAPASLATAEHVSQVAVSGGGAVTGVDSGFSFNVVTNLLRTGAAGDTDHDGSNPRTIQGSLYQFIQNANAIAGGNTMRFVPVVGTNASGNGQTWWQLTLSGALPQITGASTVIDGTAYFATINGGQRDTNTATLGYVGSVGLGTDAIASTTGDQPGLLGVNGPELEIVEDAASVINIGFDVEANNVTIRRLSIHGFGGEPLPTASSYFNTDADIWVGNTFTGTIVEDNVLGSGPSAIAQPASDQASISGVTSNGGDTGIIRRNVIAYAGQMGIFLTNTSNGWTITLNDIRENVWGDIGATHDAIAVQNGSGTATITGNYVFNNQAQGFDGYQSTGSNLIEDNTFVGNGSDGLETSGIRLYGPNNTVRHNIVQTSGTAGAGGAGVLVAANAGATGNLITQNSFSGNFWNSIDLVTAGGNNNLGDGVGVTAGVNAGNNGIARPTTSTATLTGTSLTVSGTAGAGYTIEIYRAAYGGAPGDGAAPGFGEGAQYLGTAVANGAGNWTATFDVTGLLAAGQSVTAIAIDNPATTKNTSEFGNNLAVTAVGTRTISGTIYHDVNADATVSVGEGTFASLTGVVKLYLDDGDGIVEDATSDTLQATGNTDASGNFSFAALPNGVYWVVVDSRTLNASTSVWAEQTYANANGTTITAAQGAGFVGTAGALYGGKSSQVSDVATNALNAEHLLRVDVSGGNAAGVDAGFSFNVVTNTRDADDDGSNPRFAQGTVRQFLVNSNTLAGQQSSVFRIDAADPNHLYYRDNGAAGLGAPVATTAATDAAILDFDPDYLPGTARSWYSIQVSNALGALPTISASVVLDGSTQPGYSAATGPIIELNGQNLPVNVNNSGLTINAAGSGSTMRGFVINRFGADGIYLDNSSSNSIQGSYVGIDVSGTLSRPNTDDGIDLFQNSDNNTIGGTGGAATRNVISGGNDDGIVIGEAGGPTGNVVVGNYIGTDAAGLADLGNNSNGVRLRNTATGNTIGGTTAAERNVISGNNGDGVNIPNTAGANNVVQGNYIGVDVTGNVARNNGSDGVEVAASSTTVGGSVNGAGNVIAGNAVNGVYLSGGSNNRVRGNIIGLGADGTTIIANSQDGVQVNGSNTAIVGGTTSLERNVISGNTNYGVYLTGVTTGTIVSGNYIGTDANGAVARGNAQQGVLVNSSSNTIGGSTSNDRNVISGNAKDGIVVNSGANNNVIRANYIGVNAAGNAVLVNGEEGIQVNAANGTTIGGSVAGQGNVISGNSWGGIRVIGGSNGIIQGNSIGTDPTGTLNFGGAFFGGIELQGSASGWRIGGVNAGEGNIIAFNAAAGVSIFDNSTSNSILRNSIYSNGDIGINLDNGFGIAVTPNDPNDGDAGSNGLQNFPVISSASSDGVTVTLSWSLNSALNTQYRVEFFASPVADASGNGEGQLFLGSRNVTTNGAGNYTIAGDAFAVAVAPGWVITATATRSNAGFASLFETSEFSAAVGTATISGTLYNDLNANANVADDGGAVFGGRANAVRIYSDDGDGVADAGDTLLATLATNAAGQYSLGNLANGTYWVAVDSTALDAIAKRLGRADLRLGRGGALQRRVQLPRLGRRDVRRHGGRRRHSSDDLAANGLALNGAEHVTRVIVSGANATNRDSGFSANVVTNLLAGDARDDHASARTVQGSLRQFIGNANALAGANAMVFVPAVNPNVDGGDGLGGGNDYWRLSLTNLLPQITGANGALTTIDGTAFGFTYGVTGITVRDDNAGLLGTGGTVGVDNIALTTVNRPELEIADGVVAGRLDTGLNVNANNVTVRDLAIWGFGKIPSDIVTGDIHVDNVTGALIEGNVIGTTAASFTDPGAEYSIGYGVSVAQGDTGIIRGNLIGWHGDSGVLLANFATNWLVESNEIRRSGLINQLGDGIDADQDANNETVRWNLIADNRSPAIDFWQRAANANVVNNTMAGNDTGVVSDIFTIGFTNPGLNNVVDRNIISGGTGPGIVIRENVGGPPVAGGYVRITQNSIYGNIDPAGAVSGLGIDLADNGVSANDAPGDSDNGPNALLNFPTLTSVTTDGTNVAVSGTASGPIGGSLRLEFFANASPAPGADPTGYGEGQRYIGFLNVTDGGAGDADGVANGIIVFSTTLTPPGGMATGEIVSATATRANAAFTLFFETSEFGQNFTGAVPRTISGTIRHDVDGDADVAEGGTGTFRNVTVRLFRDDGDNVVEFSDSLVATTTTNAAGVYTFANVADGYTYWVVVDSKTIGDPLDVAYAGGFTIGDVWAEQTYGAAGNASWNGAGYDFNVAGGAYGGMDGTDVPLVDSTQLAGVYQQTAGPQNLVVMQAEGFTSNTGPGALGDSWTLDTTTPGYSGTGAMVAGPNNGTNNDPLVPANSPRLNYQINFATTGLHYVWVRGYGVAGANDDSVHVGLDGVGAGIIVNDLAFPPENTWNWETGRAGTNPTDTRLAINVTTTGLHTLNIWMREDGVKVDRIVLTTDANFVPNARASSDDASNAATAEHLTRVALSGANATGVDSGFSFNVVTNVMGGGAQDDDAVANRTVQGSLRQFIQNANALTAANAMRFVPADPTNASGGGGNWWSLNVTTALPQITGASTAIDGTAYDANLVGAAQDATPLDPNAGTLGAGGTVGVDGVALSTVNRPELEIRDGAAAGVIDFGLDLRAANSSVRDLAIWGFGDAAIWAASGNIIGTGRRQRQRLHRRQRDRHGSRRVHLAGDAGRRHGRLHRRRRHRHDPEQPDRLRRVRRRRHQQRGQRLADPGQRDPQREPGRAERLVRRDQLRRRQHRPHRPREPHHRERVAGD